MSNWSWGDGAGEGEDIEDGEEENFKTLNDCIVFLVDARQPMLQVNSKGETHLLNCLKVLLAVMKSKIVSNSSALIGLTFFGTAEKESIEGVDGVYNMFSLAAPSAQRIRDLQLLIADMSKFERTIGSQRINHAGGAAAVVCPIKQALWGCSQSFGIKGVKSDDYKRIWIFTNDDNPNKAVPEEQSATITVARDCSQAGIEISLWHLDKTTTSSTGAAGDSEDTQLPFDPSLFYNKLLVVREVDNEDGGVSGALEMRLQAGGFDGFDPLMAYVRRKEFKKRSLGRVLFRLTPAGSEAAAAAPVKNAAVPAAAAAVAESAQQQQQQSIVMGVQMYHLVQVTKKPSHKWLYSKTNEPVSVVSKYMDLLTGEVLGSDQIETYVEAGQDNKIPFPKAEADQTTYLGNIPGVGVQLRFFMPLRELSPMLNLTSPYFLFPDDQSVLGSSIIFEALLRDLASRDLCAVVRFNRTKSSQPRNAVLLPQLEEIDEDGVQVMPPGFHLIPLPAAEDIRYAVTSTDSALHTTSGATDLSAVVSAAEKAVKCIQLPDDHCYYRIYENPALQLFYSVLQAVALTETECEWQQSRDDRLLPDTELFSSERTIEAHSALKSLTGLVDPPTGPAPKKRAAPAGGSSAATAAKKAKSSGESSGPPAAAVGLGSDLKAFLASGELTTYNVPKLKELLKGLGLPVSGAKAELQQRVTEYIETQV